MIVTFHSISSEKQTQVIEVAASGALHPRSPINQLSDQFALTRRIAKRGAQGLPEDLSRYQESRNRRLKQFSALNVAGKTLKFKVRRVFLVRKRSSPLQPLSRTLQTVGTKVAMSQLPRLPPLSPQRGYFAIACPPSTASNSFQLVSPLPRVTAGCPYFRTPTRCSPSAEKNRPWVYLNSCPLSKGGGFSGQFTFPSPKRRGAVVIQDRDGLKQGQSTANESITCVK